MNAGYLLGDLEWKERHDRIISENICPLSSSPVMCHTWIYALSHFNYSHSSGRDEQCLLGYQRSSKKQRMVFWEWKDGLVPQKTHSYFTRIQVHIMKEKCLSNEKTLTDFSIENILRNDSGEWMSECLNVCWLQLLQHLSAYHTWFLYLCRWNERDKKSKSISFPEDSIHDRANDFSGRSLWKESLLEWRRSCPSLSNIEYIRTSGKLISLECAMIDSLQTVALLSVWRWDQIMNNIDDVRGVLPFFRLWSCRIRSEQKKPFLWNSDF